MVPILYAIGILILYLHLKIYLNFHAFCVFSVYLKFNSIYSQYMLNFTLRILSISRISFHGIHVHTLHQCSVINSVYSQYTLNFILNIRWKHPNESKYSEWNFSAFKGTLLDTTSKYWIWVKLDTKIRQEQL
jgi:hypothetical protein